VDSSTLGKIPNMWFRSAAAPLPKTSLTIAVRINSHHLTTCISKLLSQPQRKQVVITMGNKRPPPCPLGESSDIARKQDNYMTSGAIAPM
jgi:hypothetical protein